MTNTVNSDQFLNTLPQVISSFYGGEIETAAGTFDTVLFKLRGGLPENDIYVTREKVPRIGKVDVLGQPFQFLALPTADE